MHGDGGHLVRVIRLAWDYPVDGKPSFGLQPVYYYLSKAQARQGYDVHVVTKGRGNDYSMVERGGVTVHRVPEPFSLNAYRAVKKLGAERQAAIIHTHATCGLFLAGGRKALGLPMVSHVHGCSRSAHMPVVLKFGDSTLGYSARANWYGYFRERLLWSSADRVLAVSASVKNDLQSTYGIPPDRVDAVYNGVDTTIFRPLDSPELPHRLDKLRGKRIVLYVGHFGLRKGVVFLIRAMKDVVKEVPDAALVCVGGVPKWLGTNEYWGYLQRSIAESGLEDRVVLLDRVPNDQLPIYYSIADAFVLPSYYEAFAKVVIEAMACGKPVVIARGGGPAEAIEQGVNGLLVDYGSKEQISEALITLLQDRGLATKLAQNAVRTVEKRFTWQAVAERISQSYRTVLPGFQGASARRPL